MEPETESLQPTRPAPEGRPVGTSFVIITLRVGLFLLLCNLASNLILIIYPYYCGGPPGFAPWWFQLAFGALVFSWIPWFISVVLAFLVYTATQMGCGGRISLLGVLNITVAFLLFFMSIFTLLGCGSGG
jgi:hypothetical protein